MLSLSTPPGGGIIMRLGAAESHNATTSGGPRYEGENARCDTCHACRTIVVFRMSGASGGGVPNVERLNQGGQHAGGHTSQSAGLRGIRANTANFGQRPYRGKT